MSIEVSIIDDISESRVVMKEPINNDIFEYVAVISDCLKGLSFAKETIYNGFKDYCVAYEKDNV